eukprot:GHRQ01030898.1.p2 GENE.GHRQ01030898.1~~GHRQ01030898.1.p2  ORF type:complete len:116 (-),score=28.53 GHRQ01030898.1:127-474(-)
MHQQTAVHLQWPLSPFAPSAVRAAHSLQNGVVLREGDLVSLNGVTGEVIRGAQPVKKPAMAGDLSTFMQWVDAKRRMRVLTNAGAGHSTACCCGACTCIFFHLLSCKASQDQEQH